MISQDLLWRLLPGHVQIAGNRLGQLPQGVPAGAATSHQGGLVEGKMLGKWWENGRNMMNMIEDVLKLMVFDKVIRYLPVFVASLFFANEITYVFSHAQQVEMQSQIQSDQIICFMLHHPGSRLSLGQKSTIFSRFKLERRPFFPVQRVKKSPGPSQ